MLPRLALVPLTLIAVAAGLAELSFGARAQDTDEEKVSKACELIYAKLCRGIEPGAAMVGACNRARPDVANQIPASCQTDFQNKVEGYEDFMREDGGK